MIKKLGVLIISLIPFFMEGQTTMTNREVYNFNINDEFQTRAFNAPGIPPNVRRYTITGKRYSAANDTVFYKRHITGYSSTVSYATSPPTLIYSFFTGNDSVYYTGLSDTLKNSYKDSSCTINTDTLYYSSYCNAFVYETDLCTGCCFEGQNTKYIYGRGLGQLYYEYTYAAYNVDYGTELFYYKIDTLVCGVRDTLTTQPLGIKQYATNTQISIYPNPAKDIVNVECSIVNENIEIIITDMLGNIVIHNSEFITHNLALDVSALPAGVYFVRTGSSTQKFIKQ